ncbi:ComEC family competence protein [bacterium]|nr:ComEC family competence protein [bacterium]
MLGFVSERPYLLAFIALACGIAAGRAWPIPLFVLDSGALLVWLIILALGLFSLLWRSRPLLGLGVGFGGILLIAGYLLVSLQIGTAQQSPLLQLQRTELASTVRNAEAGRKAPADVDLVLRGRVASIPKVQRGYLRLMLEVSRARSGETWFKAPGRVYAFIKMDEAQSGEAKPDVYYGSRVDLYCRLSEVPPPRNHGQFDYRAYLLQQGTLLQAFAFSPRALIVKDRRAPQPWAGLAALRSALTQNLVRDLPPDRAALAISVVYGDKITDLPETTRQRFREAGLTHILVASGTQVSLIIALLGLAFWRLEDNASWRGRLLNLLQFGSTMLIVCAYATVTGFETSILRALAMGTLVLLGKLLLRESDGLTALAQSGMVLLLSNPLNLFSASFQLSFGATFGLIYFYGVFSTLLGQPLLDHSMHASTAPQSSFWRPQTWLLWLREHGRQALISTCGAQLMVSPLLVATFYQFSVWGFVSNLLALPLAFMLLLVGALSSIGLSRLPLLGDLLQALTSLLARGLDATAALFAMLPGSQVAAPPPPWWWSIAYYLVLLGLGELYRSHRSQNGPHHTLRWAVLASGLLLLFGLLYWCLVPQPQLVSFALPGSYGTLIRTANGRSLLLVQASGLKRQHNLETLAAGLHYRGINRLHALVWLDEAPPADDLRQELYLQLGYEADLELRPGEDLPGWSGCSWVDDADSKRVVGLLLTHGSRKAEVYWGAAGQTMPPVDSELVFLPGDAGAQTENAKLVAASARGVYLLQLGDGSKSVEVTANLSTSGREIVARPLPQGWKIEYFQPDG